MGIKQWNGKHKSKIRYPKLEIGFATVNFLRLNNPYMNIWWGLAFPGFGQWFQGRHLYGLVLIVWEYFINVKSHLNAAIFLTLIGRIDEAKAVLDQSWFLMYIAIYIYCIWDSYHVGTELNRLTLLSNRERQQIEVYQITGLTVSNLSVRQPLIGACWSLLLPGAGHFLLQRKLLALFFICCWTLTMYFSRVPQGVIASLIGDFQSALRVINPQWLLFVPSLYMFACHDAYTSTCRLNDIYREEVARYLMQRWSPREGRISFPVS
jgi:hypothetical protein